MNRWGDRQRQVVMHTLARLRGPLSTLAFVWLIAAIGVVVSERMFWFWETSPISHIEASIFYSLPVAATLWMMARNQVSTWPQLLIASTIYAYVTEGVITPVMYSGGPFVPFFPVWFTAWHGMLALVAFAFGIRWLLLERRITQLTAAAGAFGAFWGFWLTTSALPSQLEDPELLEVNDELHVLSTGEFAVYAATFTLIAIVAHWLVGFVWPQRWAPSRLYRRVVGGLCLLAAGLWSVAFLWALPMFLAYVWLTDRVLGWSGPPATDTLLDRLTGKVRMLDLWPLLVMAPTATLVYAGINATAPTEAVLNWIYFGTIVVQTLFALVVLIWASRRQRDPATAVHAAEAHRARADTLH